MKCPSCGLENKDSAKVCKKCARDLTAPPPWTPSWGWHLRLLAGIYCFLILFYFSVSFLLRQLPEPYHLRKIPPETTPWLKR